ncbi:hypothetical protein BS78_01G195800 [Paspalum vaginatum]|nr:hypothetical protein BS78_01G195800 [Paspalum vaginatum]
MCSSSTAVVGEDVLSPGPLEIGQPAPAPAHCNISDGCEDEQDVCSTVVAGGDSDDDADTSGSASGDKLKTLDLIATFPNAVGAASGGSSSAEAQGMYQPLFPVGNMPMPDTTLFVTEWRRRIHPLILPMGPSRWRRQDGIGNAERIVQQSQFVEGLRMALFGPPTSRSGPCDMWSDTDGPGVPPFAYFVSGFDAAAVVAPFRLAIVQIRGSYYEYMLSHRGGLACLAHSLWNGNTSMDPLGRNQGIIRAACHRVLSPARRERPDLFCVRCSEPADWEGYCCSMVLCASCLPRELIGNHVKGCQCKAREEGGTRLRPLTLDMIYRPGGGREWVCTRQLLVQIEELGNERSFPWDVFVFRTFTSLEDLQALVPSRRETHFYHMNANGSLRLVCTIRGRDLSFLW